MGEWSLCRGNMEGRTEVAEDGLCLVFYGIWSSLWGPWGTTEFLSRDIIILFVLWQAHGSSQVALVVKNPPANAGDVRAVGSIPGWGRSHGDGHSNPLQYSCLENPMDRGVWRATVHGVAESDRSE